MIIDVMQHKNSIIGYVYMYGALENFQINDLFTKQ